MHILSSHTALDSKKSRSTVKDAIKYIHNKSKMKIHSVNEDILSRLNSLAAKQPFCASHKQRDHGPL